MAISLDGPPPLPPDASGGGYSGLMGGAPPSGPPGMGQGPGASQIGGVAVRLGMEIDQSLKLLGQSIPLLAPWVARVTTELRTQLGQALAMGAAPTSPEPQDNAMFPDGSGRL
jgi:hypothetical protein